jgi:hypothetical protein
MITSPEEFIRLRVSDDPADYSRATSEEAPIGVWKDLVFQHPEMRSWVAHNKTVPTEILTILAKDSDPLVRCVVAAKRKLPHELFELLVDDLSESVRQRIAYNKSVPQDILHRLSRDPLPLVSEVAQKRLRLK